MSKTRLVKELKEFTAEQLIGLICEVYDAKVPARDYFEYFLNPDSDKLVEKVITANQKEMCRSKRGWSKFRSTHINKNLSLLATYSVEPSKQASAMLMALDAVATIACELRLTDSQRRWAERLLLSMLEYCDRHEMAAGFMARIETAIKPAYHSRFNPGFHRQLRDIFEGYNPLHLLNV